MQIKVTKAFSLNLNGVIHKFVEGVHEVEEAIAEHWFTKAHIEANDQPQAEAASVEEAAPVAKPTEEETPAAVDAAPAKSKGKGK